ncbi:MAG TPA: host attachment protein [Devosia sp.]|jgi:protein required for attachment to host cells
MILPNGAIVAVADGHDLSLYRNTGTETRLELAAMDHGELDPGNAGSGGRHRNDSANPDPDRAGEDAFAASAAEALNKLVLGDSAITGVVVIADPRSLGELRRNYHPTLRAKLIGELHKDLSGRPLAEISAAIQNA